MTLTSEEKKALAEYRIKKAKEIFEEAKFNFEHNKFATAVNRSYYTVLNASRALLILKGIDPESHSGCKTMLSLHFVKAAMMDNKYIEYFKTLFARRTDVDYGDFELIDKEKAEDSLNKACEFLIMADGLLNELIENLTK
jgi:uncharacterized protein (UPF0332 family)